MEMSAGELVPMLEEHAYIYVKELREKLPSSSVPFSAQVRAAAATAQITRSQRRQALSWVQMARQQLRWRRCAPTPEHTSRGRRMDPLSQVATAQS